MITLLTDFGAGSEYVGALHAVLAGACPGVERIDLAHDLPGGDVRLGALTLARLAPFLPAAVHLAVVDPGVGGDRRAVAVGLAGGGALVGPDNGLLAPAAVALGAVEAVELAPLPDGAPATFHGRDLFAPAAARLAAGAALSDLGTSFAPGDLVAPDLPRPVVAEGELAATVVAIDTFGNLELLAGPADLDAAGFTRGDRIFAAVTDRRHPATVARAFDDVARKGMLVHIDAHGQVALAVNGGSAAQRLGARLGQTVTFGRWSPG